MKFSWKPKDKKKEEVILENKLEEMSVFVDKETKKNVKELVDFYNSNKVKNIDEEDEIEVDGKSVTFKALCDGYRKMKKASNQKEDEEDEEDEEKKKKADNQDEDDEEKKKKDKEKMENELRRLQERQDQIENALKEADFDKLHKARKKSLENEDDSFSTPFLTQQDQIELGKKNY